MPVYKKAMRLVPHCPVCGEGLIGNGTGFSPWRCSCGIWKWDKDFEEYVAEKLSNTSNNN